MQHVYTYAYIYASTIHVAFTCSYILSILNPAIKKSVVGAYLK